MPQKSQKVLIVEDDMIISMVLERIVKRLDFEVVGNVITGKNAIDTALRESPDLILMDIQLKDDIDGITAMETIRKTSDVPVIYITGNSDDYNRNRARDTDYIDYLVKPIQMIDLEEAIAKIYDRPE